jgi:hypothetical protein
VIVSEETRNRLGDDFLVEPMGPQTLKNVPEPVHPFRVLARKAPSAAPAAEGGRARRLYVVARNRPDVYDELVRRFAGNPDVEVVLDRRVEEWRAVSDDDAPAEHRQSDRRGRPARIPELAAGAYVVVDVSDSETEPRPRPPA